MTTDSPLLTPKEAADWLRLSASQLAKLRMKGGGPRFVKLSRKVCRYRLADLESYVAARTVSSTSEEAAL